MSLQFRSVTDALLVSLSLGCATSGTQTAATAPAAASAGGGSVADTRSLEQPSNAARLDAVQRLLRKRGWRSRSSRSPMQRVSAIRARQGQNILLEPFGGDVRRSSSAHISTRCRSVVVDTAAEWWTTARASSCSLASRKPSRTPAAPSRPVGVLRHGGERPLGSAFFAKSLDRTTVTSMVNIDIAGYGDTIMSGPTTALAPDRCIRHCAGVRGAQLHCIRLAGLPCQRRSQFPGRRHPGDLDGRRCLRSKPTRSGCCSMAARNQVWPQGSLRHPSHDPYAARHRRQAHSGRNDPPLQRGPRSPARTRRRLTAPRLRPIGLPRRSASRARVHGREEVRRRAGPGAD